MSTTMSALYTSGHSYLKIFSSINEATGELTYDLSIIKCRFGRYPYIRRVFGYLYATAPWDCYIPSLLCVRAGLYHVSSCGEPVLLSDAIRSVMFSSARIGGLGDNDDQAIPVNHNPVNHLVEHKLGERKERFAVDYAMLPQDIAALQRAFPELDVVVAGKVNHPHAMFAASRVCSEEGVLRSLHYNSCVKGTLRGDEAYIVDIGANYVRHVKKNRFNIHCCVPCVDVRDSARETERVAIMRATLREGKIGEKTFRDYVRPSSFQRRCMKLAQDCNVKAAYGMAIHSQYDIKFDDLAKAFDSHRIEIFWSVVNFDVKIFYKQHGFVTEQRINFVKKNGRIYFSFVNDPSLNYSHSLDDYMHILTEQVVVTPKGRVYSIERRNIRCGNISIKFTYCSVPPMTKQLSTHFDYWSGNSNVTVIATWDYSDSFFAESKFKIRENPVVSFTRKYIEIDNKFFDLLYGYCSRFNFNLNEIFSDALTFNTRMTINGNDIRTLNRVPSTDLMDVIVAVYCIAYRQRYAIGEKIERFVSDEKEKRVLRRIGFSDVMRCLARMFMCISVLDAFKECWSQMVDCLSQTRARSSLDAEFFESIRCIEIEEFVTIEGRYETESEIVNSVNTDTVDVQMREGFLDTIVNYTRCKYMSKEDENVIREKDLRLEVEKDVNLMPRVERYEGDEVADVELVTSKKKRKESVYNLHKVVATRSDVSSKELANARKEAFTKTCTASAVLKMSGDGHCLFWSLGYFFGLIALDARRKLWDSCTEEEKSEMPFINVFDGSDSGLGKTNCLRVYSRVFKCNVCVHGVIDGKVFVTEAYSDGCRYDKTVHLLWTVLGENGHVDVICENETDGDSQLSKFLLDNDLNFSASKLDNN